MNFYKSALFAVTNPFVAKFNTIMTDVKTWLLAIVASITITMIAIHAIKYQQGNSGEKDKAVTDIKQTIYIGGGVFLLIWIANYVITIFSA